MRKSQIAGLAPAAAPPPAPGGVTWDAAHKHASITLTEDDTKATGDGNINNGIGGRILTSKSTGKWYVPFQTFDAFGNHSGDNVVGFGPVTSNYTLDDNGSNVVSDGGFLKVINNAGYPIDNSAYGMAIINFDLGMIWYKYAGGVTEGDPEAGTDPTATFTPNTEMTFCAFMYVEPATPGWVKVGVTADFAAPSGFTAWGS